MVIARGQPWVAGLGDGIGILDDAGRLKASIDVAQCEAMDVGFGAVWTASCAPAGIIRIDARSHKVDRLDFEVPIADSEASVGAGEGAVWVVAGAGSDVLLRIDPVKLIVTDRFPIPSGSAGVRAGLGGVWVSRPGAGTLLRVDPSTGAIAATITVGAQPRFLTIGAGSVWVMNQTAGTVSRIDPVTNTVLATIPLGWRIDGGDIAFGGDSVWVRGGPALLARIDPGENAVTERYGPDVGSGSVAADGAVVWITAHDVAKIWRLPFE
jgi:virginiamycin B lyase